MFVQLIGNEWGFSRRTANQEGRARSYPDESARFESVSESGDAMGGACMCAWVRIGPGYGHAAAGAGLVNCFCRRFFFWRRPSMPCFAR